MSHDNHRGPSDATPLVILRTETIDGWPVGIGSDHEPRIRDLDLAERLGYANPHDVRKLIRRMIAGGSLSDVAVFATTAKTSGGRPGSDFWLTEAQALKVAAKSETEPADALLNEMIRVYMLARRGALPGSVTMEQLLFVVSEQSKHLLVTVERLAGVVESALRRIDALEARPANTTTDGPGIGRHKAKESILAPILDIARRKAVVIGNPKAWRKIRLLEERALRRDLGYPMDARQRWESLPQPKLGDAENIVARMRADVERLEKLSNARPQPTLFDKFPANDAKKHAAN
jgi:hypothetical protein